MGRTIYLFMWGYQDSYRICLQVLANQVLSSLGAEAKADVLLVGARSPGSSNHNPVCVEPEDGRWPLSLFDSLLDSIESTYASHPLQGIFYGDEPSMRDKPEQTRRDSVRTSVAKALEPYDQANDITSFCGSPRRIDDFYVTPVIQIPNTTFTQFPPLPPKSVQEYEQGYGFRSLIHAAMSAALQEASQELQNPHPGRFFNQGMRSAEEIVRVAAKDFLHTPGLSINRQYVRTDLFDTLNLVSSLLYEGTKGVGRLIIVDPKNEAVDIGVRFVNPVSLREPRWVRKVLQMAASGSDVIADSDHIYGLGTVKESRDPEKQDVFAVSFLDHYHWELYCGDQILVRCHYGIPKLPQEPFDKVAFLANYARTFPRSLPEDGLRLWMLMKAQVRQPHGSMVVVAEDAASEAERLGKQGTAIVPAQLSEVLLPSVSRIDGTILLDPSGNCHAIGVILDGEANDQCTPSRGSRYNSGVRYVRGGNARRLAIVVSDDRTIDIIPPLRRLVSRDLLERQIAALEVATLDNWHEPRNWLDKHRFYISAGQCNRINAALSRLDDLPKEVGVIHWMIDRFGPHPDMDDTYLLG